MAVTLKRLAVSISSHAFNADGTQVALCPNNHDILIYAKNGNDYELLATLEGHDAVVTSIAWGAKTNRILSCSHDRNAYVWNYEGDTWKPTLVLLRINRGATHCAWSPNEDKFAVASGAKVVSVCYFDDQNDWWVSKHIGAKKGISSTILSVDWHPNNVFLAACGSDKKARVFSGFVKGIDNRADFASGTPFGKKLPFGTVLGEYEVDAWVQSIKWSPSGEFLAFTCHDSSLYVLHAVGQSTDEHTLTSLRHNFLPLRDIQFIGEGSIIGVGHDANPILFQNNGGNWVVANTLDHKQKASSSSGNSAMNMFKRMDQKGADSSIGEESLPTRHQNCITHVSVLNGAFSTTGLDGNIVHWPISKVNSEAGVTI
eukprot:TRINITY_DN741_c0_g2_i1.p1 TRINITY_DN741_c0_g2~~TRINITY_DN741_c0_g2_i1.p1  ORF type:complete len:385 (-),score=84.66 TRINITY_DN741_c0_g2_i1:43-1155(-)